MPHEEQVAVGQGNGPAPVRDWRELRRALIALISEGINRSERRYTEASDLLAEYVTALDIAKGDASVACASCGHDSPHVQQDGECWCGCTDLVCADCADCDGCGLRFRSQDGTDVMAVDDCPTCGGTGEHPPAPHRSCGQCGTEPMAVKAVMGGWALTCPECGHEITLYGPGGADHATG